MKFLGQRSLLAATTVAFSILRSVGAEDASDVLNLTQDTFASTVDAEVINDRRAVERRRVDTDEFFPTFSRWCSLSSLLLGVDIAKLVSCRDARRTKIKKEKSDTAFTSSF